MIYIIIFFISIIILVTAEVLKSPLFVVIGAVLLIGLIIDLLYNGYRKIKEHSYDFNELNLPGTGSAILICVILFVLYFFNKKEYYINGFMKEKHLYEDCNNINSKENAYKVCNLSAILWLNFNVCDSCENRKTEVDRIIAKQRAKAEKERNLYFIEEQIEELQEVKQKILYGGNVNVEDYEFRKDCEEEIVDDVLENLDDYTESYDEIYNRY